MLLHLVDIAPIDESDPVENAKVIINELNQYSENLAQKPRWLVFNKIDVIGEEEAAERAKAIVEGMGWEGKYYMISAANREGVNALCWDVMNFINTQPKAMAIEESAPEKSNSCGMTTTASKSRKWKPKQKMTGMTTGTKTTTKASKSFTRSNSVIKGSATLGPCYLSAFPAASTGRPGRGHRGGFPASNALVQLHDADHDIQAQPAAAVALIQAAECLRQLPDHLFLIPGPSSMTCSR